MYIRIFIYMFDGTFVRRYGTGTRICGTGYVGATNFRCHYLQIFMLRRVTLLIMLGATVKHQPVAPGMKFCGTGYEILWHRHRKSYCGTGTGNHFVAPVNKHYNVISLLLMTIIIQSN